VTRSAHLGAPTIPEGSPWAWWRGFLDALAIILASGVGGAALVFVSLRFEDAGPFVFLALALLPVVALMVFEQPVIAVLLTIASFPVVALAPWTADLVIDPVQAMVMIGVTLVGVRRLALGRAPLTWSPLLWWGVALFAWTLVALPSSSNLELAMRQVFYLPGGILFASLIVSCCETGVILRRVLAGLIAVGALAALFALFSGVEPEAAFGGAVVSGRAVGTFNQPNQLGAFSAMVAMVAVGMVFGARTRAGRSLSGIGFLAAFAALTLSLSRGAWIGAALGGLYLIVAVPQARRAIALAIVPLGLVLVTAATVAPDAPQLQVVGQRLQAFTAENPYESRPDIWAEARRQVVADPWTGQGLGNFPVVSARSGSEATTVFADHAHNLWLNWAAETGLPGAIIIAGGVLALAAAVRSTRRAAIAAGDRDRAALVAGCAAAALTVLGQGMVDYPLKNQVIWFTLWITIGALLAARRLGRT
jgi:putative inorganic carbon (HCO3(-)) transporter